MKITGLPGKRGSYERHMKLQVSSSLFCCSKIIKENGRVRERASERARKTTRGCGVRDRHTLWFSILQC